jgi:hypothetical protein
MLSCILDNNVQRATKGEMWKTLPKNILEFRNSSNCAEGIFALKTIPAGVKFGPSLGLEQVQRTEGCAWKLRGGKFVKAGSSEHSNWMSFVNSTKTIAHQNLTIVQYDNHLYYRSKVQIYKGEELLVFHDEDCIQNVITEAESFYCPPLDKDVADVYACTICCLGFSSELHLIKHRTECPLAALSSISVEGIYIRKSLH